MWDRVKSVRRLTKREYMSHYLANDPATIWPENMFFEDSEVKGACWCREENSTVSKDKC